MSHNYQRGGKAKRMERDTDIHTYYNYSISVPLSMFK